MPANIDRLVAERERLARNSEVVSGMMKTQQVSDWHERQYHRTGGPTVGERQADEAELELRMANASVDWVATNWSGIPTRFIGTPPPAAPFFTGLKCPRVRAARPGAIWRLPMKRCRKI